MSIRRRVLHRLSACLEDVTRLRELCQKDAQRADMDAALALISGAVKVVDESISLGAAQRRPYTTALNFEALLSPDDVLRVTPNRVAAARVAASSWGKRHGVRLSVTKQADGSAVVRLATKSAEGVDVF